MKLPSLPQNDPPPLSAKRKADLAKTRGKYQYDYQLLTPLPLIAELPSEEENTTEYNAITVRLYAETAVNTAVWQGRQKPDGDALKRAAGGTKIALDQVSNDTLGGWPADWPETLAGYDEFWQTYSIPTCASRFRNDDDFARMRLQGPNPMELFGIERVPDHFPVTDEQYRSVLGAGDSLEAATREGRLFMVDYAALDGLESGTYPTGETKYVQPCMGLFAVPPGSYPQRDLVAVAIQCGQTPDADTPIFTPRDGFAWQWAKSALTVADGNMHQAVQHFAYTHMAVQPFAMAMNRQLSAHHPLYPLLWAHTEGTIEVNDDAQAYLICSGGGIDIVMAGTIEATREVVGNTWADLDFDRRTLRGDLAARGVDDPERLPNYPYRDDALLHWDAIEAWVGDYLRLYYRTNADVQKDAELQAWMREINADDGGRFKNTGQDGGIQSVDYLVGLVTHVIFRSAVQHAAVNFPQAVEMAYAPDVPLAAYAKAPSSTIGVTEQDWIRSLPPLSTAYNQLMQGKLLGGTYYTQLGQYGGKGPGAPYFADPRTGKPMKAFQTQLSEIEAEVDRRNEVRADYTHLKPSLVPQSTNI